MSLPEDPILPVEPPHESESSAARVRRRRATRRSSAIPTDAEGQAELIASLARRAYPSIELFVFSLACGAILGLGYLLDSQAVLLFGILVAPLMTPWVGFLLALLSGSMRFMFETVMALIISLAFVFLGGLITGFAARLFMPITLNNVFLHSRLWIPELLVFALGAITLVISFARSEDKPFLPSVLIAYAFYLPISASGFGIGSGLPDVWLQGLLVFAVHFGMTSVLGLITLFILRLRPSLGGILLSGLTLVLFIGLLVFLMGSGSPFRTEAPSVSTPTTEIIAPPPTTTPSLPATSTQSPQLTATSAQRTQTPTAISSEEATTDVSPSAVPLTLEITLPATETPTITLTIQPTPVYGKVAANEGGGANLRDAPGGTYVMTLLNGTIVEATSEFADVNTITWVKVIATVNGQRIEGWLLESVISYATPAPNFEATATPNSTPTPSVTPKP
ncbi:MAG: DUF389 domain-containing protein [Anaerolineales bacterium]|nr:DUF389 domain-containing protein [Anaerolineales bacterium]